MVEYGRGSHVIINCYGCPKEKIADPGAIIGMLNTFPEKIGLPKLSEPVVFRYGDPDSDDWGITGVVLSDESHVTIHTFPEKGDAFMNVFSTRGFDADFVLSQMTDAFGAKDHELQISSHQWNAFKNTLRQPA